MDGNKFSPNTGENFFIGGLHELARPDGADFLVVGDVGTFSLKVQIGAAAVRDGGDKFSRLCIANAGFKSTDGDFFEGASSGIWEVGVSQSNFKDECIRFRGVGSFIEQADWISESDVELFSKMTGKLIGTVFEGFLVRNGCGFAAFPFVRVQVTCGHWADYDVLVVEDVDVLCEP